MGHLLRAFRLLRVKSTPIVCYRGLPAKVASDQYTEGAVALWQAVTSTTRSQRVAVHFAAPGGVILAITVYECADIDAYSTTSNPATRSRRCGCRP